MKAPIPIIIEMFSIPEVEESIANKPSAIGSDGTGKNGITDEANTATRPSSLNQSGSENDNT